MTGCKEQTLSIAGESQMSGPAYAEPLAFVVV